MNSPSIPEKLQDIIEMFDLTLDRNDRYQLLIDYADKFKPVQEQIATRPFPEDHRVPSCESQAFVFAEERSDGLLNFYFAVENPNGISAKAISAIMHDVTSGAQLDEVLAIEPDIIFKFFNRDQLGIARSEGLRGIIKFVRFFASKHKERLQSSNSKVQF